MDITPQLLKEVKFSESWRGYDRDEVDEFLERVGAGVALVQGRLREAVERAEAAETRAHAMGGRSEAEETLKRTLVLAQRTADAAVAEANETAARTVSEAEARAQRTIADAEAHAAVLRAEAEAEVRRVIESTRAPLVEEIKELERVRNFLRDDVELLEGHLDAQRERLRGQLGDIAALLDEPTMLRPEPTPETSGVDPASVLGPLDEAHAPAAAPVHEAAAAPAPVASTSGEVPAVSVPLPPEPAPAPGPHWSDSGEHQLHAGGGQPGGAASFDAGPATFSASRWDDAGPPTQPVAVADLATGSDSFLDQLRRAVDDEPDDDGAMTAFFDQDDDDRPRSRFGRRR